MAIAYNRGCPKERTAHMCTLRGGSNYSTTPCFFQKLCCTFSVLVSHIWGIKMNILQKLFQGKCIPVSEQDSTDNTKLVRLQELSLTRKRTPSTSISRRHVLSGRHSLYLFPIMERLADPLLAILVFTFLGQNRFLLPYGIWNRRRREAGAAGSFPEGYRP